MASRSNAHLSGQEFSVRQISSNDWQAYRDFYKDLIAVEPEIPHMYNGIMLGKDLDARETYVELFKNTLEAEPKGSFVMFGLWDKERMIGSSAIDFTAVGKDGKNLADFEGSEILPAFRGGGLVDKFYDARMQYLRDRNFDGDIKTTIRPDNYPSLKAAKRNGFEDTGTLNEHGKCVLIHPSITHASVTAKSTLRPH